jgi:penicillin amidase
MKTCHEVLFSITLFILAAATSGFVLSHSASEGSSKRYESSLFLPGLTYSVTVYRDERGMPHIYAGSEHDLYLTAGYISAQERLWQMDLIRRSATGRLSEIFGKSFLQADIFCRCLQINEKSKNIIRNEDPAVIDCMKAYVDGVNSFIDSCRKLPLEFRLLTTGSDDWVDNIDTPGKEVLDEIVMQSLFLGSCGQILPEIHSDFCTFTIMRSLL